MIGRILGSTAVLLSTGVAVTSSGGETGAVAPSIITVICPGPQCPYTPPSANESGAAADVLARINLERAAPARDYLYDGAITPLDPYAPAASTAEEAAQAAAEWQAAHGTVADYGGAYPARYSYGIGGNAADAGSTAGIDNGIMHSYGHALGVLSAAATQVAVGAACSATGTLYVTELFLSPTEAAATAGQARFATEIAENNIYTQSDGATTSVTDSEGTLNARYYLPQQPIVAGSTPTGEFATGVNWTCDGPEYPTGHGPQSPLGQPVTALAASAGGTGYLLANAAGAVDVHGDTGYRGDATGLTSGSPVVSIATTAGAGYWLATASGGVFAFGDATYLGSLPGAGVSVSDVVAMVPTPGTAGYRMASADGGVFAFGSARYQGSLPGIGIDVHDIVGAAGTPTGDGYWLVAADGGVFAFGDARYFGSLPGVGDRVGDVTSLVPSAGGGGYWLVAADGGVFAFGSARYQGSLPGIGIDVHDIVGAAGTPTGGGYWLVAADGGVFAFGDAPFEGAD